VVTTVVDVVVAKPTVEVVLVDDDADETSPTVVVALSSAPVHAPINATKQQATAERFTK
jgi:hypothetical protein